MLEDRWRCQIERLLSLPSSSPAYASMIFATKLVAWRVLGDVLGAAADALATKRGTP